MQDQQGDPVPANAQLMVTMRVVLTSIGVSLATKYGIDGSVVPAIVSGLLALLTASYSIYNHRKQGLINTAAKAAPEVKMVAPDAIASAGPANVVKASENKVVTK